MDSNNLYNTSKQIIEYFLANFNLDSNFDVVYELTVYLVCSSVDKGFLT